MRNVGNFISFLLVIFFSARSLAFGACYGVPYEEILASAQNYATTLCPNDSAYGANYATVYEVDITGFEPGTTGYAICQEYYCESGTCSFLFDDSTDTPINLDFLCSGGAPSPTPTPAPTPTPTPTPPIDKTQNDNPVCKAGSIIMVDSQTLGESVPIVGTPFSLYYFSDRTSGNPSAVQYGYSVSSFGLGNWNLNVVNQYDTTNQVLRYGNGSTRSALFQTQSDGSNWVLSGDGSEVYVFNTNWKHVATLNGLTGSMKYMISYDTTGRLLSVTDAYMNQTAIQHSGNNPTAIVSPYGQVTNLTVDANGNLATITNPNNETFRMSYHSGGQLRTFVKPSGTTSIFSFDLSKLFMDSSSAGSSETLQSQATSGGISLTDTTALGRMTSYQIGDNTSGLYSRDETLPTGETSTYNQDFNSGHIYRASDSIGTSSTITQSNDVRFGALLPVTTSEVDTRGSLQSTTSVSQNVSLSTPSNVFSVSTLSTLKNVNGRTSQVVYSGQNLEYTFVSPEGRQTLQTIDRHQNIIGQQRGTFTPLTFQYDSHGRLDEIDQGPRTTKVAYNSQGFASGIVNALNETTQFLYDGAGRVTQQTFPDGRLAKFAYDSNGNITSVTPPGKPVHDFTFNGFDLIASYLPPSLFGITNVSTLYAYNNDKQLTLVTRPDGKTIQFNYDPTSGLLVSTVTQGGDYGYTYSKGVLQNQTSPDTVVSSFVWNGPFLASQTNSGSALGQISFTYNNDFVLQTSQVQGSAAISYSYDKDLIPVGAGAENIVSDPVSGLFSLVTLGKVEQDFRYSSNFGELSHIGARANSRKLFSENMKRDSLGRIIENSERFDFEKDSFEDWDFSFYRRYDYGDGREKIYDYTYDAAGRLTKVAIDGKIHSQYTYDSNSNRIEVRFPRGDGHDRDRDAIEGTYDAQDRLLTYGDFKFTYNANGDLESKTDFHGRQKTVYSYDVMGNLKSVILPDGKTIDYLVDAKNRRVGRKVNGRNEKFYVYDDQSRLTAELDSKGNVVSRFVYGTKKNIPDYFVKEDKTYEIVSDHLGSPVLIVNAETGKIAEKMSYGEFGNVLESQHPGFIPFGFAGCLYDSDTHLCRFGTRDYDANTGRWNTRDPILFGGGDTNLYGYVLEDPVNGIDVTGTQVEGIAFTTAAEELAYIYAELHVILTEAFGTWCVAYPDACANLFKNPSPPACNPAVASCPPPPPETVTCSASGLL